MASIGKPHLLLSLVALFWTPGLPVLACDCGMYTVPDIPGETSAQHFLRVTQAQSAPHDIIVTGRFISVKGVSGLFKGVPNGRFEVLKSIKGDVGPFITIYNHTGDDCGTPWIFEQALSRHDSMVISLQRHESATGKAYEINLCDISYYSADLEKSSSEIDAKDPQ